MEHEITVLVNYAVKVRAREVESAVQAVEKGGALQISAYANEIICLLKFHFAFSLVIFSELPYVLLVIFQSCQIKKRRPYN